MKGKPMTVPRYDGRQFTVNKKESMLSWRHTNLSCEEKWKGKGEERGEPDRAVTRAKIQKRL